MGVGPRPAEPAAPGATRFAGFSAPASAGRTAKVLPTHRKGPRTWLFRDLWNLDNLQGMDLRQGVARWRPEGTFEVPMAGSLSTWPLVYRDKSSGRWRMLYTTKWLPYTLKVAASDDGIRWQPEPHPEIQPPEGEKLAPQPLADLSECGPLQAGEAQPGGKVRSRDPVFSSQVFVLQQPRLPGVLHREHPS